MRAGAVRDPQAGAQVVRVGDAVEHEEQRRFHALQDFIHGIRSLLDLDAGEDALVPAAAVEAVQAAGRHAHEVYLRALGHGSQVLRAGVVAGFVEINLEYGRRIGAQPSEYGVKAEHYPRLAVSLAAHLLSLAAASSSGNSKSKREITASPSSL